MNHFVYYNYAVRTTCFPTVYDVGNYDLVICQSRAVSMGVFALISLRCLCCRLFMSCDVLVRCCAGPARHGAPADLLL